MIPIEAVPLVAGLVMWVFTMLLAAGVDLERPSRRMAALPDVFDAPVVTAAPPVGYKAAQIIAGTDSAWFAGMSHQVYGVAATATCRRDSCTPPAADCGCGFYAFSDEDEAVRLATRLSGHPVRFHGLLQVEMSGEVLGFERGIRGARQRVLRVEIAPWCHRCARSGRRQRAAALSADRRDRRHQLWCDARPRAFASLPPGSAPVRPVCARHVARSSRALQPVDVAGLLGTEVRWRATPAD